MKILFLGTPSFAVASLEALVLAKHHIVGVVTAPDKPAGRGLTIKSSAVKEYASANGIPVYQPLRLNDPEFLSTLQQISPDLMIVVAFRMLPESVWSLPPMGTFNLHASLLPQYRGAAPINRAIINGEQETGVTTFFLKHQIDTGNILFREHVSIGPDETAGELHDRLKIIGSELVVKTVVAIRDGTCEPQSQDSFLLPGVTLHEAPKIFQDDCLIQWDRPVNEIHNRVRGLSPHPGAFTVLKNEESSILIKIYRSAIGETGTPSLPGAIAANNGRLHIHCQSGMLEVLELQQQGKKKMAVADFLRGFKDINQWRAGY